MTYDTRETVSDYYPTIPPQAPAPEVDPDILEAHLLARDNPHVVTAEQVGTYAKGVIDKKIEEATTLNKTELNKAVSTAQSSAQSASSSASSASSSANAAKTSEDAATTKAKEAATSASTAATSATNAATSETNAATSAKAATNAVAGFDNKVNTANTNWDTKVAQDTTAMAALLSETQTAATAAEASATLAAEKAGLVPAIVVDAEAVLEASRVLIGTDGASLVALSDEI